MRVSRAAAGGSTVATMSMMRFGEFFWDLAMDETRCITLLQPLDFDGVTLPPDQYGFDELYCVKPGCDCRRVMLNVLALRAEAHVATINHGFDPPRDAYDPPEQTFLDPLNQQTEWSPAVGPFCEPGAARPRLPATPAATLPHVQERGE